MSPCTKKLSDLKGKKFKKYVLVFVRYYKLPQSPFRIFKLVWLNQGIPADSHLF